LISFIIPALADEPYLPRTLKSIEREIKKFDYKNFEILVMIKDKDKKLPDFLKNYEDSEYLKFYITEGNISVARNEGIKKAKNNILTFVDADTEIGENFIKNTLEDFERGYAYVNYSARPLKYEGKKRFYYYLKLMNFFQWLFTNMNIDRPYGFCMSIRKDVCEKIKINDEVFLSSISGYGEDSEFGRRCGKYCRRNKIRGKYEARTRAHTSMREWYKNGFWKMSKRVIINGLFAPYLKKPLVEWWRNEK